MASLGVCGFATVGLAFVLTGVSGATLAAVGSAVVDSTKSAGCLPFFDLMGVAGMTGTAGVIVDEVVRDIGRDPGRESVSAATALGMAGTVNPGGTMGVALRGCSKKLPLREVLGVPWTGSLSLSFTSASTLKEACSSALKGVSSVQIRQPSLNIYYV